MSRRAKLILLAIAVGSLLSLPLAYATLTRVDFKREAAKVGVDPIVLEAVCRHESGSGRVKHHRNKNGTWDVGYCQNHRYTRSETPPPIPSDQASLREAARELAYWKKQHNHFCVETLKRTGECGYMKWGKWRGIKNCKYPHLWVGHYNWGFRVLENGYDKRVQCRINNGMKACKRR